jgi:FKBP-type peptidyl-prolyl cis-trans isomerase FkpA
MKQRVYLLLTLSAILLATGCNKMDYKKTKDGLLYKIISTKDSKGEMAKQGNVLKLYFEQKLNDSVLQTNFGKMPIYPPVENNPVANDYNPVELFTMLHKGDSAIAVMLVDSLILKGKMQTLPPFMKRGDRITFKMKVLDLFASDSLSRVDQMKEMASEQGRQRQEMSGEQVKEAKVIESYLSNNKITTQKTPKGAYVQILNPGQGAQADSGKYVSVKYKGTTLEGRVFDSNMDSSFHHMEPLRFGVGAGEMWAGFDDGVRFLKKGGKARIYIPAVLANGPNPIGEGGKPYENVVFDVEILDVTDKPADIPQAKPDSAGRK